MTTIKVVVNGAAGKMGREVVKAVTQAADLTLVGACDQADAGEDAGLVAGIGPLGIKIETNLEELLQHTGAEVMVDFTEPGSVVHNVHTAIRAGVHGVVGTTGLSQADLEDIDRTASAKGVGVLVAPNFAIGACLMMRFAEEAARWFPHVEIIELHHDQKKDAPSGTALKTGQMIAKVRENQGLAQGQQHRSQSGEEWESLPGARGGKLEGIHIHSVRLPGFVAHQEVIFGLPGQTLTLRHDSTSRESFMPGVLMGIRRVKEIKGLMYGLDKLLF
ncbi:MAG: 4-hydroxy-tetrahydrodipicolinate reductase [Firmicutes bacterium]|nr:4-hydroxy-tetrahydrodipicolinate reductase [Bacillota bacterium]